MIPVPSVNIETSIPSILTARPSRDVVSLAHQQTTAEWWDIMMPRCAAFVSDLVIAEAQLGNAEAASRRLHAIATLPVLPVTQDVITLSKEYTARLPVPRTAEADMIHLAVATLNGMNYLLTWNCKHIANAFVIESLARVNHGLGLDTPIICTPEELFHED